MKFWMCRTLHRERENTGLIVMTLGRVFLGEGDGSPRELIPRFRGRDWWKYLWVCKSGKYKLKSITKGSRRQLDILLCYLCCKTSASFKCLKNGNVETVLKGHSWQGHGALKMVKPTLGLFQAAGQSTGRGRWSLAQNRNTLMDVQ